MARSKKKTRKMKFELGLGSMAAVAVSTMCVLLWVFVLGFWVGQKMVGKRVSDNEITLSASPPVVDAISQKDLDNEGPPLQEMDSEEPSKPQVLSEEPSRGLIEEPIVEEKIDAPGQKQVQNKQVVSRSTPQHKAPKRPSSVQRAKTKTTYYALQIAAYRKRERANKEAARWARKGYFTKVKQVDLGKKGVWYRVYLGRLHNIREAKKLAVKLADTEGLKSYIVPVKE